MSGYLCVMVGVVDVPAMSISGGDARPGDQVLGLAGQVSPGAASLPVDAQATFLRVHGRVPGCWLSGVSALMRSLLQLRAIGARYATASALPLRRRCAAHRGDRATVGPSEPDAATLWPGIHG
jgi:hypothetical protein